MYSYYYNKVTNYILKGKYYLAIMCLNLVLYFNCIFLWILGGVLLNVRGGGSQFKLGSTTKNQSIFYFLTHEHKH